MATTDAWTTQEINQTGCSKRSSNEAAGSMATEAYPLGYVARRLTTENEVGSRFQHPYTVRTILPKNLRPSICS